MPNPQNFVSGVVAAGSIGVGTNATALPITGWSVQPQSQMVTFRNSLTGLATLRQPTFRDISGTIDIDFDAANSPFTAPLNLADGQTVNGLKLYLSGYGTGTNAAYWDIPKAIIQGTPQSVEYEGKPRTQISFVTNGPYYTPGNPSGTD